MRQLRQLGRPRSDERAETHKFRASQRGCEGAKATRDCFFLKKKYILDILFQTNSLGQLEEVRLALAAQEAIRRARHDVSAVAGVVVVARRVR